VNVNLDDLLREKDWRRCAPNWEESSEDELLAAFMYFCENYWCIRHPSRGKIKFDLREAQIETVRMWLENRYSVVLKARQIGFSTLVAAFAFWITYFYSDRMVIMLSKTERDAIKLLQKSKYGLRFLPDWMKLRGPITNVNQTKMEFSNESTIESLPSASDPARGEAVFLVVVDEVGQLPNSDEAWAAIEPVADVGGRVIMLGTANGEGNLFHRIWTGSQNGTNRFKGIFFPWWAGGERDEDWYEAKKRDLPEWQLAQEYPSDPEEAFLRSGRPVFNVDKLREIKAIPALSRGYLRGAGTHLEFVEDGGALRIWEAPQQRHVYVIGADVAEGLSYGDYSSAHVIDVRTGMMVAHWHGHVDADLFGSDILFKLGAFYNQALVGVESNNHGLTTLKALQRHNYRPLYRQRRLNTRNAPQTEALGWRTTAATKPLMIDELGKELRDGGLDVVCPETVAELRVFVREGDGKMHGSPHDDRVISLAIANQMRKYAFLPEYRADTKPGPGTFGWFERTMFANEKRGRQPIGATAVRSRTD
jgi:hypothetical protein